MSTLEEKCDGSCTMPIQPVHFSWREEEVKEMFRQHDGQSIARLHRLGFLRSTGQSHGTLTPLSECWHFHPADILNNKGYSVATELSGQSLKKLVRLSFEALIQQSLGLYSPETKAFLWEYDWLNAEICRYFIVRPRYTKPLANLKKVCSPTTFLGRTERR